MQFVSVYWVPKGLPVDQHNYRPGSAKVRAFADEVPAHWHDVTQCERPHLEAHRFAETLRRDGHYVLGLVPRS